jgi:hypothetical protein
MSVDKSLLRSSESVRIRGKFDGEERFYLFFFVGEFFEPFVLFKKHFLIKILSKMSKAAAQVKKKYVSIFLSVAFYFNNLFSARGTTSLKTNSMLTPSRSILRLSVWIRTM